MGKRRCSGIGKPPIRGTHLLSIIWGGCIPMDGVSPRMNARRRSGIGKPLIRSMGGRNMRWGVVVYLASEYLKIGQQHNPGCIKRMKILTMERRMQPQNCGLKDLSE